MQPAFVSVVVLAGLSTQPTSTDGVLRLSNVTINMARHFSRGINRVEARINNPNDFVVYDVVADCSVKSRRGGSGTSFTLTVADAIQGNATRVIRDLHVDTWPEGATMAYCISSEAKRLPE
jgi:hypothetical protein